MNKFFGDNRFNFFAWIFTAFFSFVVELLLFLASLGYYGKAIRERVIRSSEENLLVAIWFVLVAVLWVLLIYLCLALQNYFARVSKTIEEQDQKDKMKNPQS